MCLRYAVSAGCLPAMQPLIAVRSRGTDAALSLRIAADRKRMPTVSRFSAPAPVSLDPRRFARRRVSTGQCGPRLAACTGLLMAIFAEANAEHRLASAISCSPIWMVNIQSWVSNAITVPHEELRGILAKEKQLVRRRIADRGEQAEGLGCETMPKQTGTALNFGIGLARFSEAQQGLREGMSYSTPFSAGSCGASQS